MEGWTDGMTDRKKFGKRCNDMQDEGWTDGTKECEKEMEEHWTGWEKDESIVVTAAAL